MGKRILLFSAILVVLTLTIQISRVPEMRPLTSFAYWQNLFRVGEAMRVIHIHHVDSESADFEALGDAALEGMSATLDRYSQYLSPEAYEDFLRETEQSYVGIGVQIQRLDDRITVTRVFPDSPADAAGIRAGDRFEVIDGRDVQSATLNDVVDLLRGLEGTDTEVSLERPDADRVYDFQVTRGGVEVASIEAVGLVDEGIGYLRIRSFGRKTVDEFQAALDELEGLGMRGLVIDLRDNPGGLLTAAVGVAGEFFERGDLVVETRGRGPIEDQEYRSRNGARQGGYPIAILINGQSASASEVVAGALQDIGRAVVVGQRSVGKGSVQSLFGIGGGAGLRTTTANYYTPSGRSLTDVGIEPDVQVEVEPGEWFQYILQEQHRSILNPEEFQAQFGAGLIDIQLETAIDTLLNQA